MSRKTIGEMFNRQWTVVALLIREEMTFLELARKVADLRGLAVARVRQQVQNDLAVIERAGMTITRRAVDNYDLLSIKPDALVNGPGLTRISVLAGEVEHIDPDDETVGGIL